MKQFQKLTENQNAITVNEEFEPGSGDFTEQLDKIEAAGVKVVLIPVGIDDAENILKQAYERHMDVKFLGIDSWNGEELVSAIGKFRSLQGGIYQGYRGAGSRNRNRCSERVYGGLSKQIRQGLGAGQCDGFRI